MLKKSTNHNSTAGLNGSAAVSTGRPTTKPADAFETVQDLNGNDVNIKDVCEAFVRSLNGGSLDIPQGQRHSLLFSVNRQIAGWLGSETSSIAWALRDVCPTYPDFMVDVAAGTSSKYRYDTVSYQLRPVLEQFNIIRPFKSKSSSSVSPSTSTATAAPVQQTTATADASPSASSGGAELLSVSTGDLPTDVFNCLPPVLQMCAKKIPHWMRQPWLFQLLSILCMFTSASVTEADNTSSKIVIYSAVVGEASSGKSRLQKWLRKYFLQKILQADEKEREKYEQFKKQKQKANSSQALSSACPDLGVRVVTKVSVNQLLEYMKVANKKQQSMLLITDEISGLLSASKQSSYTDLSQLIRCGFNGDTLSSDSLSQMSSNLSVDVNLNVCVAGQVGFMLQFFGDVTDGSSSRYLVSFLEQNIFEMPKFLQLSDEEQQDVDKLLDAMQNFKPQGPIKLPRTVAVLNKWREAIVADLHAAEQAGLPFDKSKFSFSIRQATIALRVSALMYIMQGGIEDHRNEVVALYVAEQGLMNIYSLCADKLNSVDSNIQTIKANRAAYQNSNTKLMALLPDEFNINDLQQAMGKLDLKNELQNAKTKCSELVKLKFAKHKSKGLWSKVKTTYKK